MILPDAVRQAVEKAMSERFGGPVRLDADIHNFWPTCVFRCTLLHPPRSAPNTVIVRIPREGSERSGRSGLYHEHAALQYLAEIGSEFAPQIFAGGGTTGFVVTEDFGFHPSLLDLLLGDDPQAAQQGILAFAHGLGRLHAQTAVRRNGAPASLPVAHVPVVEHWKQVRSAIAQFGLPAPEGVDEDVEALGRILAEPGDSLALSNGDPSFVNCKIIDGKVRFFDFEAACFRHPLVDAVVLRYPYPTGGPPWLLPHDVALQVEAAYRSELAQVWSVAQDDDRFERGMAVASAAWTIVRMARLRRVDAGPDRDAWTLLPPGWSDPIPMRSRRRQLTSILETCIASARCADAFTTLAAWCERLAVALRERWPEASEALPRYPAFL